MPWEPNSGPLQNNTPLATEHSPASRTVLFCCRDRFSTVAGAGLGRSHGPGQRRWQPYCRGGSLSWSWEPEKEKAAGTQGFCLVTVLSAPWGSCCHRSWWGFCLWPMIPHSQASNVFVSPNLSERLSLPHSLSPVLRLRTPSNAPGANEAPRGLRGNSVLPSPPLTDCHPGQDNSEDAQGSGSLRDCC